MFPFLVPNEKIQVRLPVTLSNGFLPQCRRGLSETKLCWERMGNTSLVRKEAANWRLLSFRGLRGTVIGSHLCPDQL